MGWFCDLLPDWLKPYVPHLPSYLDLTGVIA